MVKMWSLILFHGIGEMIQTGQEYKPQEFSMYVSLTKDTEIT